VLYRFDLKIIKSTKDDLPHPKIAQISLANYPSENGTPLITPKCYSFNELDSQINNLIGELEEIRKKAKKEFSKNK